MACVSGEMRTLKTGSRWRWGEVSPNVRMGHFPGITTRRAKCVVSDSTGDHCWWVPVSTIVLCSARRISSVSFTRLFTQSTGMSHPRAVCHNPPRPHIVSLPHHLALSLSHCLALSRSHTELSHVRSHTSCHMASSSVDTTSCFIRTYNSCKASNLIVSRDRATHRHWATVRRTIQRTIRWTCNAQVTSIVVAPSNCCCTHTVVPTTAALLLHRTSHTLMH